VPAAPTVAGPQLSFRVGNVTAREIARTRVLEVGRHNSQLEPRSFPGLIEVALEAVRRAGGDKIKEPSIRSQTAHAASRAIPA
jgi:hypothetical protein